MSYTLEQLRSLPTDKLIAEHDRIAKNTGVGVAYYLEELARRDTQAASEASLEVTKTAQAVAEQAATDGRTVRKLTVVITVLTVVNVVVAVLLLIDAL